MVSPSLEGIRLAGRALRDSRTGLVTAVSQAKAVLGQDRRDQIETDCTPACAEVLPMKECS